ncbi:hypothetical protein [Staphylococcus pettenkoferi]|uniref:hypothetical protein n=1 Tax=Staphylococcus pettenkoferi TaxID=170573 RepID=UPI002274BCF2|nr:hypothetical protein [Staphylococcus pettenkoferi]MCY1597040.1 hypothetical protein [Staphylococcus pettenkoferi]
MSENFLDKAKDAAKNVSDTLKKTDNDKAKEVSDKIDSITGEDKKDDKKDKKDK